MSTLFWMPARGLAAGTPVTLKPSRASADMVVRPATAPATSAPARPALARMGSVTIKPLVLKRADRNTDRPGQPESRGGFWTADVRRVNEAWAPVNSRPTAGRADGAGPATSAG